MIDVTLVLGMQVTLDRENHMLTISQEDYTNSILGRFAMGSCEPASTLEALVRSCPRNSRSTLFLDRKRHSGGYCGNVCAYLLRS